MLTVAYDLIRVRGGVCETNDVYSALGIGSRDNSFSSRARKRVARGPGGVS